MIRWNQPVIDRQQFALFTPTLDGFVAENHPVRFVAEVLEQLDFSAWEAEYVGVIGQPPIHPRVMAGVILYGLTLGIRSSRRLEDACGNRLDFIWLAEGRVIDHTTICKFRGGHHQQLKELFRQVVLTGRAMGLTRLNQVAWDGTRVKASNSRHNTARLPELSRLAAELDEQFERMMQEAAAADGADERLFGQLEDQSGGSGRTLPAKLAQAQKRLERMKEALATLREMQEQHDGKRKTAQKQAKKQAEAAEAQAEPVAAQAEPADTPNNTPNDTPNDTPAGPTTPDANPAEAAKADRPLGPQIPLADPQSRVLPNKEGGHAPNYTPVIAMDVDSRLVVDGDVVPGRNEEEAIVPSLERIEQRLGQCPAQGLADSGFHTAENLLALEQKNVQAMIPAKVSHDANPAESAARPDPTCPVPPERWPMLPVNPTSKRLDKAAFVYDEAADCYWCPLGHKAAFAKEHNYQQGRHVREYRVYQYPAGDCAGCALRSRCIAGRTERRQIYREASDAVRRRAAQRLKTEAGRSARKRRFRVEGPFGIIKAVMGVRQFLLRGLAKVKAEWDWIMTAYNLRVLWSYRRPALAAALAPAAGGSGRRARLAMIVPAIPGR